MSVSPETNRICRAGWVGSEVSTLVEGKKGAGTHVSEREERAVEEEHDAEEHEERAERRQRDADFCGGGQCAGGLLAGGDD